MKAKTKIVLWAVAVIANIACGYLTGKQLDKAIAEKLSE